MEIDRNALATSGELLGFENDLDSFGNGLENFRAEFHARFDQFEHRIERLILDSEDRIIAEIERLTESMKNGA